jgi:hypothetical protein
MAPKAATRKTLAVDVTAIYSGHPLRRQNAPSAIVSELARFINQRKEKTLRNHDSPLRYG